MAKRDYYDILGVSKSASADEIKKAHRKLVRQHHPDVNKNNPKSTELFKEVQEAYDVLSDAEKRKQYDQFGHVDPRMGPPPGAGDPFEGFRRAGASPNGRGWRTAQGGAQANPADFGMGGGGDSDFSSIFEQMFGGAASARQPQGRSARRGSPQKGEDLEHAVQLTFEQAALGTTLPIRMQIGDRVETIDIKVPTGIAEGSKIRIKGKGHPGLRGGEPGDLYITAHVAPHPFYRRDGLDISVDVPVSIYDALLGAKVTVPTLAGEVTLTLPPGTSSGAKLRIKGRGITRGADTGDAFAVIKITVPKDLSPEARALVEQLREAAPLPG